MLQRAYREFEEKLCIWLYFFIFGIAVYSLFGASSMVGLYKEFVTPRKKTNITFTRCFMHISLHQKTCTSQTLCKYGKYHKDL